jgi:hypothetical protein
MKKILAILILLIIVALVIFLLFFKGFGGFGKDSGEGKSSDRSITETIETTEADEIETTTVLDRRPEGAEITVSGHDYIFNNEKISLDDLAAEISKLDKESLITINADDTAAKNTVDDLTDKLDELGYKNYNKFIS